MSPAPASQPPLDVAARVVAALGVALPATLGTGLRGLYVHGSWIRGDFAPQRSDLDLCAVLAAAPTPGTVDLVRGVHERTAASYPSWAGRIEVEYVALTTIAAFVREPRTPARPLIARISPGEGLHLLPCTAHRLLTWASVREVGASLAGPPAPELLPPIDPTLVRWAVREHVRDWPLWARGMEHVGGQVYAVLTVCRAWCLLSEDLDLSKRAAADRAATALPRWAELIGWAKDWWYAEGLDTDPTRGAQVVGFVDEACAHLLVEPAPPALGSLDPPTRET